MRKSAPLFCALLLSLSARRAWIEITRSNRNKLTRLVALRKESVDRNMEFRELLHPSCTSLSARRAWIEMLLRPLKKNRPSVSLSARRAWIEIFVPFDVIRPAIVALRKESVDRNLITLGGFGVGSWSLSARRAWIEMLQLFWSTWH